MSNLFLIGEWWNPFSWIGDAIESIAKLFLTILIYLGAVIYSLINYVYQIFITLAKGGTLFDNSLINGLINRLYIIIGVIILFLVAYSLLKNMVNPDENFKGKKSPLNIIKDVIISIVLIAFIPTIFDFAFTLQTAFLTEDTIGKIILGSSGAASNNTIKEGGRTIATTLWKSFFVLEEDKKYCDIDGEKNIRIEDNTIKGDNCNILIVGAKADIADKINDIPNINLDTLKDLTNNPVNLFNNGTFNIGDIHKYFYTYGTFWKETDFFDVTMLVDKIYNGEIRYLFVIDIAVGIFSLYVLMVYCIDMAVRLVKLAVFELIAPLPILSRIIPNENGKKVFSNWIKATLSTFTEVFIRIALLYFAVLIISTVSISIKNIFGVTNVSETAPLVVAIAQVLVIVGIILFIKQAPALIKEITGLDGGKYSKSLMKGAGMMFASVGGGTTAAIRSFAGDKDKPLGRRFARALSAGAIGNARGFWKGRKTEKFGDIPKNAGKAASDTLAARARVSAAGGNWQYFKQFSEDKVHLAKDWIGGTSGALKSEKEASDRILKIVNNVKATAEDYIDKHLFEYYADANVQRAIDTTREEIEQARKAGNQSEVARLEAELQAYEAGNSHLRLDVIKARSEDMNISAEERANAANLFNRSRKSSVDRFATDVHHHVGAEKESAQVKMEIQTMSEVVQENRPSLAVQNLQKGNATYNLEAFEQPLTTDNAGEYFKAVKAAAEFANIENQAKLNEQERREERRKASSSSNEGKGK